MFTAMIMICLSGHPINTSNCIIFTNQEIFKTEEECEDAIAFLVMDQMFQNTYTGYEPKEYACYSWNDPGV